MADGGRGCMGPSGGERLRPTASLSRADSLRACSSSWHCDGCFAATARFSEIQWLPQLPVTSPQSCLHCPPDCELYVSAVTCRTSRGDAPRPVTISDDLNDRIWG